MSYNDDTNPMSTAEEVAPKVEASSKTLNASQLADVAQHTLENTARQKNTAVIGWLQIIERDLWKTPPSEINVPDLVSRIQNVILLARQEALILTEIQQSLSAFAQNPEKPVVLDERYKRYPILRLDSNQPPGNTEYEE